MLFVAPFSLPVSLSNQQPPVLQLSECISLSVALSGAMFGILDMEH